MKSTLAVAFALLTSIANAATPTPPKVVFFGDYFTYNWTSAFAANPNWINKGVNGTDFDGQDSGQLLAQFQTDVVNLHPAIVHIMMGAIDSELTSPESTPNTPPEFAANLDAMVKQAKAANIKVVLGISPGTAFGWDTLMPQITAIVQNYAAENNIEVSTSDGSGAFISTIPVWRINSKKPITRREWFFERVPPPSDAYTSDR